MKSRREPLHKKVFWYILKLWDGILKPTMLKRQLKYFFQRITRGFSDKQCWDLDAIFAKFIIPRLKRMKEVGHSYPISFNSYAEWCQIVDEMIWSFEFVLTDYGSNDFYLTSRSLWETKQKERMKKFNKGMALFAKHYNCLWS